MIVIGRLETPEAIPLVLTASVIGTMIIVMGYGVWVSGRRDRASRRLHRRLQRLRAGFCPRCSYDVQGISERCPECGETFALLETDEDDEHDTASDFDTKKLLNDWPDTRQAPAVQGGADRTVVLSTGNRWLSEIIAEHLTARGMGCVRQSLSDGRGQISYHVSVVNRDKSHADDVIERMRTRTSRC